MGRGIRKAKINIIEVKAEAIERILYNSTIDIIRDNNYNILNQSHMKYFF